MKELKSFVLNVPGTYPAWKINGEMITGMMSPSLSCFPAELKFIIKKNWIISGKTILECFKAFNMKKRLFFRKLREDFNIMTYVIRLPDSLSHHTHLNRELVSNYVNLGYKKIDEFIGELIKENDFHNLFIFSDHGLKYYNYEFNLSRWLEKNGLLFINKSKRGKLYSLITRFYDIFRPLVKIDYKKYHNIKKLSKKIKNENKSPKMNSNNKNQTKVSNFVGNVGGLFLSSQDKNKKKIIRNELEKDKRIKAVKSSDIDGFPDLFIILKDEYLFNHKPSLFIIGGKNSIDHTQRGIFLAYGKDIKKGNSDMVSYKDIAPTILKLNGIDKLDYMKGKVLDIFKK